MNELVYPRERTLGRITLVLGVLVWLGLIVGTFGVALIALAVGFLMYLFIQSALIAHIRGNGVELSEAQFPDLYAQFTACCDRLQIEKRPQAYILNGNGGLNAFATKFLGTQYVVLMSDVVDAMDKHADGVRFYIGHELGHLRMKHLSGQLLRWPVLWLPLLGAAYSRARESTCDRHGLACSQSPENAARALAALSAGARRWERLDATAYLRQADHSSGFWMSFHELTAGYPWLTKRAARVMDANAPTPPRNRLAYLLAVFFPYAGRLGAGFGLLILVYIVFVIAAVAIPAYQDYTLRAQVAGVMPLVEQVQAAAHGYVEENHAYPESLNEVGLPDALESGPVKQIQIVDGGFELTLRSDQVKLNNATIVVGAYETEEGGIGWSCSGGTLEAKYRPPQCRP